MSDDQASAGSINPPPRPLRLKHPVTTDQLPENPEFDTVFIDGLRGPITAEDWAVLADYMSRYPQLTLHIDDYGQGVTDLEFLSDFGWLTRLYLSSRELKSVDGLRHVPQLKSLNLEPPKGRISLEVLKELTKLVHLSVTEHSRSLDVISELLALRSLNLESVKRDDFDFLVGARNIEIVSTGLGGSKTCLRWPACPS